MSKLKSNSFEIVAEARSTFGKAAIRRLRRLEDKIPGVVYGAKQDPMSITMQHNKIKLALANEAFYSRILTLDVDGNKEKVVLKGVQRHPFEPKILHVDFFRISANEKLTMNIPLHFIGADKAPGVKADGEVSHLMNEVEIRCLPADLPEFIEVDISNLNMNEAIHLSELKLPAGVEVLALTYGPEHDQAVVNIHPPRAEEEIPTEAAVAPSEVPTTEQGPEPSEAEAVEAKKE